MHLRSIGHGLYGALGLALSSPVFAGVQCQLGGHTIRVSNTLAHFDYSARGAKG